MDTLTKIWIITMLLFLGFTCFIDENSAKKESESKVNTLKESTEIKIGQIWINPDTLNPFEPKVFDTLEIIDLRDGYVLYKFNNKHIMSSDIDYINCCDHYLLK